MSTVSNRTPRRWCRRACLLVALTASAAVGCGTGGGEGPPPTGCQSDLDCSNGVFCDGIERCAPSAPDRDSNNCVAGVPSCLDGQSCEESSARCVTECSTTRDADGDGVTSVDCGGADCDDGDANRFPGNIEVCDALGHDEDCDPATLGARDADGDGDISGECCNTNGSGVLVCGTDCNDTRADVRSSAVADGCDSTDSDCDGRVDEDEPPVAWYVDCDGDGFGDPLLSATSACARPLGTPPSCASVMGLGRWVSDNTDCDDGVRGVNPGAPDVCDGHGDNNCDGVNPHDGDGDGSDNALCGGTDCNDGNAAVGPGRPDVCDGIDTDCDGVGEDQDGDGHLPVTATCSGGPRAGLPIDDCDDFNAAANPQQSELCDGVDNDCDGTADEGDLDAVCAAGVTWDAECGAGGCLAVCVADLTADCDNEFATGCETNLTADPDHCGGCGRVCSYDCSSGSCQNVSVVSSNDHHSCIVTQHGRVACAGRNSDGRLGLGFYSTSQRQPRWLARFGEAEYKARRVSAGVSSTCVRVSTHRDNLREFQRVVCFGDNERGQLGGGLTGGSSPLPVMVVDPSDPAGVLTSPVRLASGLNHHCATQDPTGRVLCWGNAEKGALGTGATSGTSPTAAPVLLSSGGPELTGVREITAGDRFTCALVAALGGSAPGQVFCWGAGDEFQLGDGSNVAAAPYPVPVMLNATDPLDDAVDIAAGDQHVCAARADGSVVCWGAAGSGQLGSRPGCTSDCYPLVVPDVSDAFVVGAGRTHSCAAVGGSAPGVWCWGAGNGGRLGVGTVPAGDYPPTRLSTGFTMADAEQLDLGGAMSCALRSDGRALCWGVNDFGQLGTGTDVLSFVPTLWARPE